MSAAALIQPFHPFRPPRTEARHRSAPTARAIAAYLTV